MKRKIALLLSVIMTVSGLSTNAFAAGSNTLQQASSTAKVIINDTVTVGDIITLIWMFLKAIAIVIHLQ